MMYKLTVGRSIAILTCLLITVLAGCSGQKTSTELTAQNGTFSGVLEIEPYPPAAMQDINLKLFVSDSDQPVVGANIELVLTMPGCTMAPSFVEMVEIGTGVYQTQTVLSMEGGWQVDAKISTQTNSQELTFFFSAE